MSIQELPEINQQISTKANKFIKNFQQEMNDMYQQVLGLFDKQQITKQTQQKLMEYQEAYKLLSQLYLQLNVNDKFTQFPILPTKSDVTQRLNDVQITEEYSEKFSSYYSQQIQLFNGQLNQELLDDILTQQNDLQDVIKNVANDIKNDIDDFVVENNIDKVAELKHELMNQDLNKIIHTEQTEQYIKQQSTQNESAQQQPSDQYDLFNFRLQQIEDQMYLLNDILQPVIYSSLQNKSFLQQLQIRNEKLCKEYLDKLLKFLKKNSVELNNLLPIHLKIQINDTITTQHYNQIINQVSNYIQLNCNQIQESQQVEQQQQPNQQAQVLQMQLIQMRLDQIHLKQQKQNAQDSLISLIQKDLVQTNKYQTFMNDLQTCQIQEVSLNDDEMTPLQLVFNSHVQQAEVASATRYALMAFKQFVQQRQNDQQFENDNQAREICVQELQNKIEDFNVQQQDLLFQNNEQISTRLNLQKLMGGNSQKASNNVQIQELIEKFTDLEMKKQKHIVAQTKLNKITNFNLNEQESQIQQQNELLNKQRKIILEMIQQAAFNLQNQLQLFSKFQQDPILLLNTVIHQYQLQQEEEHLQNELNHLVMILEHNPNNNQIINNIFTQFVQERDFLNKLIKKLMRENQVINMILQQQNDIATIANSDSRDAVDRLEKFELQETTYLQIFLQKLKNKLIDKLQPNLTILKQSCMQYQVNQTVISQQFEQLKNQLHKYYNLQKTDPVFCQLNDQFNNLIEQYTDQVIECKIQIVFDKFNEININQQNMYQQDLCSQQYRLLTVNQNIQLINNFVKHNIQQTTQIQNTNIVNQSRFMQSAAQPQNITTVTMNQVFDEENDIQLPQELKKLIQSSQLLKSYFQIIQLNKKLQKTFDFQLILSQTSQQLNNIEDVTNQQCVKIRSTLDDLHELFINEKLIQIYRQYVEYFRLVTQQKQTKWQSGSDASIEQVVSLKKLIQQFQNSKLQQIQLTYEENLDQLLNDQIQLNQILKSKYDESFSQVGEQDESSPQVSKTVEFKKSQPVPRQQAQTTTYQSQINQYTNDNQQQLPVNVNQTIKLTLPFSPNANQIKQAQSIFKDITQQLQVSRLINKGMTNVFIQIINFQVIKLEQIDKSAQMIKIQQIKTIRQKKQIVSGIDLHCCDIYLENAKNAVFAFKSEQQCKNFVLGVRICIEWKDDLEELKRILEM